MNLALCSYIRYFEIGAAPNRPKKVVFWLVCLQSVIRSKLFQCRNMRLLRLGILIIIQSFIIFNELQVAHILLMLMLLSQVLLSVKNRLCQVLICLICMCIQQKQALIFGILLLLTWWYNKIVGISRPALTAVAMRC